MRFPIRRLLLPINYFMKTLSVFFISICCCFLTSVFPLHAQSQKEERGLMISEGLGLYSAPYLGSDKIEDLPAFKPMTIIEVGQTWNIIDGPKDDICSKSPWIKIKAPSGKTGWVFGSWILKICSDDRKISGVEKEKVKFQDKDYQLTILNNYTYPIADENGLTGCPQIYMIALYTKNFEQVLLFEADWDQSAGNMYCCLSDDDGGTEKIAGIETKENQIILHIEAGYQEDSATYDLILQKNGDRFTGTQENYKRIP
jgi:hypothetical protein